MRHDSAVYTGRRIPNGVNTSLLEHVSPSSGITSCSTASISSPEARPPVPSPKKGPLLAYKITRICLVPWFALSHQMGGRSFPETNAVEFISCGWKKPIKTRRGESCRVFYLCVMLVVCLSVSDARFLLAESNMRRRSGFVSTRAVLAIPSKSRWTSF